ncbi:dihydrofolate reductase family protein [Piscinibacter koreensis]|uniref:Dihydrofolate reductase n=1 Tax=Piscinibacter koreensis TaxID=2742824 RepID=A0A7Y6NMS3_9BURK|nr:dihydrofolate reductase family protein [Schlegelella koreensis]NUZ06040.1 dihydrofolate reductase [Schlegelella koreensis]
MTSVRVAGFGVSLDGFAAGPEQSLTQPLGRNGPELFQWFFPTRTFRAMVGQDGGSTGVDDQYAQQAMAGFGAFILGRNMFGPVRGPWPDETWKGWWGDNPPYHAPTFILTHHPRPSIEMEGGTTFYFVSDGIESALRQARAAAGDKDVKIGGGVETVRQYLRAGLVDTMHLALAPVALGEGEALFAGIDLRALGFRVVERAASDAATHVVLARS